MSWDQRSAGRQRLMQRLVPPFAAKMEIDADVNASASAFTTPVAVDTNSPFTFGITVSRKDVDEILRRTEVNPFSPLIIVARD